MNGTSGHVDGVNGHGDGVNGHAEPGGQAKPSLRLSFSEYKRISNLLVLHLRRAEEGKARFFALSFFFPIILLSLFFFSPPFFLAAEEEEELKKSAVVNWYLKEIESEIDSEEELLNKKGLIEKVLHRLVHYVSPTSTPPPPHTASRVSDVCVDVFLPGPHPHPAVPGWTEGLGISRHRRRRSGSGCQPELHPGGLVF